MTGPSGIRQAMRRASPHWRASSSLVGYDDGPPLGANMRYGDSTVGAAAAFAAFAALVHRELTGHGQFVDVSAVEVLTSMIGDSVVKHALTGAPLTPDGNHHPDMSPHGCYPCADGDWISIAAEPTTPNAKLCVMFSARARPTDLTVTHDAGALAQRLRDAGVAPRPRARRRWTSSPTNCYGTGALLLRLRSRRRPTTGARAVMAAVAEPGVDRARCTRSRRAQ